MTVMEMLIDVFYLFVVSPRDHVCTIMRYRSRLIYSHQSCD